MALRQLLPRRTTGQQPDISLAIVNIVLLLIFFFLATGRMANAPTFAVELSETTELPLDHLPKPMLTIAPDGSMELDGEPVDDLQLSRALEDQSLLHLLMDRNDEATKLIRLISDPEFAHLEVRLVTVHRSEATE